MSALSRITRSWSPASACTTSRAQSGSSLRRAAALGSKVPRGSGTSISSWPPRCPAEPNGPTRRDVVAKAQARGRARFREGTHSVDFGLACGRCSRTQRSPHHQPRGRATHHLAKAGPLVQTPGSEEHEVVMAALRLVDRVRLEHADSLIAGEVDGSLQEFVLVAMAAVALGDVGAHDRPDRSVVDGLHDSGPLQLPIFLPRPEADPSDRNVVGIADEPRGHARSDQPMQLLLMTRPGRLADAHRTDRPVEHAPAATHDRPTRQVEELLQVSPCLLGERTHLEHGRSLALWREPEQCSSGVCREGRRLDRLKIEPFLVEVLLVVMSLNCATSGSSPGG